MSVVEETTANRAPAGAGSPYLVVSGDSHAGPSLERQLRPYCPEAHRQDFDAFVELVHGDKLRPEYKVGFGNQTTEEGTRGPGGEALLRTTRCAGQQDPNARLADMDADGIAADVIFAGGQNGEFLPWAGGFGAGDTNFSGELRAVGCHIWNQWLADYVSVAPDRLVGVMQIPIWDLDAAIAEMQWGRDHGLKVVNFPAPRPDYAPYNDPVYDRFWAAVVELDLPLDTHAASGEPATGAGNPGAYLLYSSEVLWLSRRGLGQLIFGGVFDRYPALRLAFAEQRASWPQETLRELDSAYLAPKDLPRGPVGDDKPAKLPSEYWAENCAIVGSFMAPYESALRHEVGLRNLMWGSDYPHVEGTWPRTRLALRNTFAGIPEDEVRMILGDNALRFFGLDASVLRPIADRIGPTPAELAEPLTPEEFPEHRGLAFRQFGSFS